MSSYYDFASIYHKIDPNRWTSFNAIWGQKFAKN